MRLRSLLCLIAIFSQNTLGEEVNYTCSYNMTELKISFERDVDWTKREGVKPNFFSKLKIVNKQGKLSSGVISGELITENPFPQFIGNAYLVLSGIIQKQTMNIILIEDLNTHEADGHGSLGFNNFIVHCK